MRLECRKCGKDLTEKFRPIEVEYFSKNKWYKVLCPDCAGI